MSRSVKPIPEGYHGATPYLSIKGATEALDFYKRAFGAVEIMRIPAPGGRIGHAEIKIGDAPIMLADECPEMSFKSPETLGGSPVLIHLYVADVDAFVDRAVKAGATVSRPVADQFYGDRAGKLEDPFGHSWYFATRKEELSPEELQKRAAAMHEAGVKG